MTMIAYVRKALTAGVVAALAFAVKDWDGGLTAAEYGEIVGAFVAAAVATYAVPNQTAAVPDYEGSDR